MTEKPFVFDYPLVKTQRFSVSMPDIRGRFFVERKEIIRQQHNMGCTDGMKEGEVDVQVHWDVTQEIDPMVQQKVIEVVREELKKQGVDEDESLL